MKKEKKISEKKNVKQEQKKKNKHSNKELYWIIGIMVSVIVVFLIANSFFQSLKYFEYEKLNFEKIKVGNLDLMKTNIYIGQPSGGVLDFTLYLRNDPRKNNVPVDGNISFPTGKPVFITFENDGFNECEDASIGIATLSTFVQATGLIPKTAFSNKQSAEEFKRDYVTCDTNPKNVVILMENSTRTKITKQGKFGNCYVLSINNCEVMPTVEKFEMRAILDSR